MMKADASNSPWVLSSNPTDSRNSLRKPLLGPFLVRFHDVRCYRLFSTPTYLYIKSKMKYNLLSFLCAIAIAAGVSGLTASAQDLKIAVVDMQEALNKYYKTDIEVGKINTMAEEKRKSLDGYQAAYQQMTNKMTELDKTARDTLLDESVRKDALEQLQALAQERAVKGQEIGDAQRKASAEVMQARTEMEESLVAEIKGVLDAVVTAQGLDLVFDKSFLPKANKAIVHTSENVLDLTEEVISKLNAAAPATTTSSP